MAKTKVKGESSTTAKIKELTGKNPEKINEEQLARLQSSVKTIDQLTHEVGQIEIRKHALMKAMESVQKRLEEFRQELVKEYGTDNINIQTGAIAHTEENSTPNPKENGETDKKD